MNKFDHVSRLLAAVLSLLIVFTATSAMCGTNALKVGDIITDFTLPDGLSGGEVNFNKDIKGKSKLIVIFFMTTSCSACKAEMSLLNELENKYKNDIKLYAVSVDLNGEKSVPVYNELYNFNVRYMLDTDFTVPQLFGFTFTPGIVIADTDGKIIFKKGGYSPTVDSDRIAKAIEDALIK